MPENQKASRQVKSLNPVKVGTVVPPTPQYVAIANRLHQQQVTSSPLRERRRAGVSGDELATRGSGRLLAGGDSHDGILQRRQRVGDGERRRIRRGLRERGRAVRLENVRGRDRRVDERGFSAVAAHGEAAVWQSGGAVNAVAQLCARDDCAG
jgi:hypothetical protein